MRTLKTMSGALEKPYLCGFGSPFDEYNQYRTNFEGKKIPLTDMEVFVDRAHKEIVKKERLVEIHKYFGQPKDHVYMKYNKKAVVSGNIIEYYMFPTFFERGLQREGSPVIDDGKGELEKIISKHEQRIASRSRTGKLCRRLINSNQKYFTKFVTLTFDPKLFPNANDVESANEYFSNFMKRLKRLCVDKFGVEEPVYDKEGLIKGYKKVFHLKYICSLELQENGNVHYHMVCNVPFMEDRAAKLFPEEKAYIKKRYKVEDKGFWSACWGAGFVDLAKINIDISNYEDLGGYLVKYMSKSFLDSNLFGKKLFFRSRNLDEPQELFNEEAEELFQDNMKYITGVYNIKTNYATFTKVTIFKGKLKRDIKESSYEDSFLNLSEFIFEYETGLFKKKFDDVKMDLKSLFHEGYITEDNYFTYAMILKQFKQQQKLFEYAEEAVD